MMLEVHFSVAMLGIAGGTYVAGLYGMNVLHSLEEASNGFALTTGQSLVGIIGLGLLGLWRVRKIRHMLRLYGGHGLHVGSDPSRPK